MKNLITKLIFTFSAIFLMTGCTGIDKPIDKKHKAFREAMSLHKVVEFDGCEYILFYGSNSELRYDGVTHKGNCKNH